MLSGILVHSSEAFTEKEFRPNVLYLKGTRSPLTSARVVFTDKDVTSASSGGGARPWRILKNRHIYQPVHIFPTHQRIFC